MSCIKKGILLAGIIIFVIANVWAPWQWTYTDQGGVMKVPTQRYCIFGTPSIEGGGLEVDIDRAILQSLSIAALTAGLMCLQFQDQYQQRCRRRTQRSPLVL